MMQLNPEALALHLPALKSGGRLVVAYSGGLDSHVLLHCLAGLRDRQPSLFGLRALHIHHGVNPQADHWVCHCQTVCQQLQVPLTVRHVRFDKSEASLENQLRNARYLLFEEELAADDLLALAHHADDQMETLLLRMVRGTGPRGLSGMPGQRALGKAALIRPLLTFTRADLEAYARQHQLSWIEDDSNADVIYDRNYLRHQVTPALVARWPHLQKTFARNAQVHAEAGRALDFFLERELQPMMALHKGGVACDWLQTFEPPVQRNLLRAWLQKCGLPLSGYARLQQILTEVLGAAGDANPNVCWAGAEVHRFKGVLYAFKPLAEHDGAQRFQWHLPSTLVLAGAGRLSVEVCNRGGLLVPEGAAVTVAFRQGGERCRPVESVHSALLKKRLQELGLPPWLRDRVPLIYINGELAAVADQFICEGFQAASGQQGYQLVWLPP